jgi:hypothetical protein
MPSIRNAQVLDDLGGRPDLIGPAHRPGVRPELSFYP